MSPKMKQRIPAGYGEQRESEGAVVPVMALTNNGAGRKGPCVSHAEQVGTREGMAGKTGPNHPDDHLIDAMESARDAIAQTGTKIDVSRLLADYKDED